MSTVRPIAPGAVRWIVRTLEEAGYETWAVGGAVRDTLMGRTSVDWDLATKATPQQVRKIFSRTVPVGIDHGTVGVLARDGVMYELTTFRRDVQTDGRHALVEFAECIEDDLSRRDFTINAIAWHPLRDEFYDPFGGEEDLSAGTLRTVGDADQRFEEDYLRILRALRFAGRFDLHIEDVTWRSLVVSAHRLKTLSPERIRDELMKVLSIDPSPSRALSLYREAGVIEVLYPEIGALREGLWDDVISVVNLLPIGRPKLRLAALLRPVAESDAARLLVRLRLSNADMDAVARIASATELPSADSDPRVLRRWLSRHGRGVMRGLSRIEIASARTGHGSKDPRMVVDSWNMLRAELRTSPPLKVDDLAIDGGDLKRMGLKPGPVFGEILNELLEHVLEEPQRNQKTILAHEVKQILGRRSLKLDADVDNL